MIEVVRFARDAKVVLRSHRRGRRTRRRVRRSPADNDGYNDIPVGNIGEQFLANALGGLAIALGLGATAVHPTIARPCFEACALWGVVWAAISLVASYFAKRTDGGWFNFVDQPGLQPSPGRRRCRWSPRSSSWS